jgi:hypothetical protein
VRNCSIVSPLALVAVLTLWSTAFAQTADQSGSVKSQTAGSTPDLSGVWQVREFQRKLVPNGDPPFQPWAAAKFRTADITKNDPNMGCLPHGVPRIMFVPLPMEIFHVPGRVLILQEALHQVRQIYTDGRQHPKDLDPSWTGHSIGRWEGDALVVDTIGMNDKTWLDHVGLPHSDALHVVERIRRVDHDTLQDDFTIDDPKAYTKPLTAQQVYKLKPDWEIQEYVCEENNRYKYEPQ